MSFVASGKAVILNSRQTLYPCGTDPWIIATARAIDDISRKNLTLLASVGTPAWEIALHLAGQKKIPIILIMPGASGNDLNEILKRCCGEFRLDAGLVNGLALTDNAEGDKRPSVQTERDRKIIEMADVIYPVSVRPGGNLVRLLSGNLIDHKILERSFTIPWQSERIKLVTPLNPEKLAAGPDNALLDYVIHWTRGVHYPWPGETRYDYYDAVVRSHHEFPRSALHTLIRILAENRLRASTRHMRTGISAVSFSSLPPSRAVELMRWRARYREMTFEPYGIAIRQPAAERAGIRKTFYGHSEMIAYLAENEKPYFQSLGNIGEWQKEREYRHIGDLDLRNFDVADIRVITRTRSEIPRISSAYEGDVLALSDV